LIRRKKQALLLTAVLSTAIWLAGCGGSTPASDSSSTPAPAGVPAATTVSPPAFHRKPSDLTLKAELLTPRFAWALTRENLLATGNAGRSWHPIKPSGVTARALMAVLFSDRRHGIVVTSTDAPSLHAPLDFYRTADGGRSWRRSTTIPRQTTIGGATLASHGDRVWALTGEQGTMGSNSGGHLYLSEDRGATWRQLPPPPLASASIGFASASEGWLDGGVGRQALWRTTDGGRSWKQVGLKPPKGYGRVFSRSYELPQIYPGGSGLLATTFARRSGQTVVGLYVRPGPRGGWRLARTLPLRTAVKGDNLGVFATAGPRSISVSYTGARSATIVSAHRGEAGDPRLTFEKVAGLDSHGPLSFADREHVLAIGHSEYCPPSVDCTRRNDVFFSEDSGRRWRASPPRP
jgi:hypothetical protein